VTDHAVVVGIAKYPGLTDLAGPDTDAQAVYDWLVDPAGGRLDTQNVELIRSAQFDPVDPRDPKPASGVVKAALVRIAAKTQQAPGNRLYLYFSGHGFAPTLEEGALLTAEASQLAPFHVYAHSWLKAFRRAGLFRDVVLWMDCCMNFQQSIMVDEADMRIAQSTRPPGPAFVGLAAQTKSALEHTMPDGKVHGVFTWTLLEGLRGGASDERGRVTGESLKSFLQSAMPEFLPEEARRAAAVDLHPFVRADEGMVFTRFAERPTYPVRLRIPEATAGQRLHLWTGRPHVAAVSQDLDGPEWTGRLVRGLYVAEVPDAGLRQGFQVTGSGQVDVAITETGPPVKRADWSRLYPLNVVADNAAAEIMVADYKFDRIFTETGALHDRDAAGVYKIRVQIGRDIATASEKVVLLDRELVDGGQVAAPPLPSPAPIPGSALTSESHVKPFREAAARAGDFQPARPGAATISIMARYWTDPATPAGDRPLPHPMEGLQLSGTTGSFPDFRPEDRKVDDQAGDPVAVWEREVAPGVYYFRQTLHDGRQLEAAVVAVAGWVTQVVIQRALPGPAAAEGQAAAAPLDEAAVFMRATHKPRRPGRDAVIEAARIALAQGRNLFAEGRGADLQNLLLRKCDDPIGGIIGCHLLLVAMDANGVVDPARTELFDIAVRNLRRLVGPDHPDVAALSLRASDPELRFPGPFTAPPMFARSWQLMTDASYDRPDLIPAALWDRVHASIALGPFLVWAADEQSRALHAEQLTQWAGRYAAATAATPAPHPPPGGPPTGRVAPGGTGGEPLSTAPTRAAGPAAGMAVELPVAGPPDGERGPLPEAAREAARQAHIPAAAAARLWER
jgi:Caspase domain